MTHILMALTLALTLTGSSCYAIETGFYPARQRTPNDQLQVEADPIVEAFRGAEEKIWVDAPDRLRLSPELHSLDANGKMRKNDSAHYFVANGEHFYTRKQCISYLRKQHPNNKAVVIIGRLNDHVARIDSRSEFDECAEQLGPFVSQLPYKRVVLLGLMDHPLGFYVYKDTQPTAAKSRSETSKTNRLVRKMQCATYGPDGYVSVSGNKIWNADDIDGAVGDFWARKSIYERTP